MAILRRGKMKNIESLKNYVGNVTEEEFMILATKIYMITDFICDDYPKHKEWYFTKQLPATINGDERNNYLLEIQKMIMK